MKAFKTWTAALAVTMTLGCSTSLGVDLTGLWVAESYEYRNSGGSTVDLIARDGASMSLTVDRFLDGRRRVTVSFDNGMGETEIMSGEVFTDEGLFEFEDATFTFERRERLLILVNESDTFDFGGGAEPATLTIRLTQL